MMRELPRQWITGALLLVVALFLYGREQRHAGRDAEREQALQAQVAAAVMVSDTMTARYHRAIRAVDSVSRRVPAVRVRWVQAAVRVDSVLVLVPLPDTVAQTVAAERLAAVALIGSLEETVAGLRLAVQAADSVILAQSQVLARQAAVVRVLDRQAHPSVLRRVGGAVKWAAVGAVTALAWTALR